MQIMFSFNFIFVQTDNKIAHENSKNGWKPSHFHGYIYIINI